MILVWGFKSYVRLLGIMTLICGNCHNPAAQRLVEVVRKFTLFWIPLFPVKKQAVLTCTFCGMATKLTKEQAAELTGQLEAAGPSAAGAPQGVEAQSERHPIDGQAGQAVSGGFSGPSAQPPANES